jgi:hypothetical protein
MNGFGQVMGLVITGIVIAGVSFRAGQLYGATMLTAQAIKAVEEGKKLKNETKEEE